MVLKELYLCNSIDELDHMSLLSKDINKKSIDQICKSIQAVGQKAASFVSEGDEEGAYVMYMKYFELINTVRSRQDFDQRKKAVLRLVLGSNDALTRNMDRLGQLKVNLKRRYAAKFPVEEISSKSKKEDNDNDHGDNDRTIAGGPSLFISCHELKERMENSPNDMLLIDCRPAEEFAKSSIISRSIINIPDKNLRPGLSANMVTVSMPSGVQSLWERRGDMQRIILFDWNTSNERIDTHSGMRKLKDIMAFWDPNTKYNGAVQYLESGYQNFLFAYPMLTTNPKYQPSHLDSFEQSMGNLDGIEYPSMNDIKMKADPSKITNTDRGIPRIDRTSKGAVEQKYLHGRRSIEPMTYIKEKEMLVDDILAKDEEVLKISTELTNVLDASNATNDPAKASELIKKQTELEYTLMQKENELNDTFNELKTVDQFEDDKDMPLVDARRQPGYTEANARLLAKTRKHSEMEQKHKESALLLETKRMKLKEQQKIHLEIIDEPEEDTILPPRQPAFDRSMKPTAKAEPIKRNFSPEHGTYGDIGACGLKNLGNTCYMNSIIQCLMNIRGLNQYLKSGVYEKSLNRRGKTQGRITEEFAVLCSELWSGRYKSVAPKNFRYTIGQFERMFSGYEQQDSHEFLTILIDRLHSELQMPIGEIIANENLSKSDQAWREFIKNRESIVQHLFYGQIRSTVKCCHCGYESATYEGFSNLSLELPQGNGQYDLFNCFDLYFDGETISGWTCPTCKQVRDAIKKLDIARLPPLLVIHLKRFYMDLDSSMTNFQKKQNYVRFPIQDFDVQDYVTRSAKMQGSPTVYNLCGVSNHYGTMDRGHYTAFCRNFKSNSWYKFDDNYVSRIHSNEVNSSASYILFYAGQQLGD